MLDQLSLFEEHSATQSNALCSSCKIIQVPQVCDTSETDAAQDFFCKVIRFPRSFDQSCLDDNNPYSDPLNYDRDGNYIGPPPEGYVWASTFKKDGTRKLVHRNSYKGEEKKAYPIVKKEQLEAMASWLYANKDKKYLLAFVLGINLGLRANELLSLRKHDLFLKDGTIRYIEDIEDTSDHIRVYQRKTRNSKSSKYRNVFLNAACVDILNWYFPHTYSRLYTDGDIEADRRSIEIDHCRGGSDLIFPSPQKSGKKEMSVDGFRKVLEEASKACGLPQNIATHTIRKTFGIANGITKTVGGMQIDVDKVQRLLGHSSGETTLRYLDTDQMSLKADYHSCCLIVTSHIF